MSYDISIRNRKTLETVRIGDSGYEDIGICGFSDYGGTYQLGEKTELSTNMTYNYVPFLKKVFGEDGIRSIYGICFSDAVKKLDDAIEVLKNADQSSREWTYEYEKHSEREKEEFLRTTGIPLEEPQGYWRCTVPNVLKALEHLKFLTDVAKKLNPDGFEADFEISGD